jgi:antitoxin HicB
MTYTVVLERERDGGYSVHVPALKGCRTQGDGLAEALDMAREAILCHVEAMVADGESVPSDVRPVAVDLADGGEALVLRVSVPDVAPAA